MKKIIRHFVVWFMMLGIMGCAAQKSSVRETSASHESRKHPPATVFPEISAVATQAVSALPGKDWQRMFDGTDLKGWKETQFAGRGEIGCDQHLMVLRAGDPFTGLNWTNDFPKFDYEITLEAMRVSGSDFFCGLTVPVGTNFCSLIVGGWGGSLIGISSLDGMDASENETTKFMNLDNGRWYRIRFLVTLSRLQVWVDQEMIIDADITAKRISVRPGDIEMSEPVGLSCWMTAAAYRDIQWRKVTGPEAKQKRKRSVD